MTNDLIPVGNFLFVPEAEAACLHLHEEGIQAFLSNAELVNMDWFLGNATGYVKVLVPESQAAAARAVLDTLRSQAQARRKAPSALGDAGVCLACGAKLTADQSTCPACGWSYATADEVDGEMEAGEQAARPSEPVDAASHPQASPETIAAKHDESAQGNASDDDAEEQAETSATNFRLLLGLIVGGIVAAWLLPLLRAALWSRL